MSLRKPAALLAGVVALVVVATALAGCGGSSDTGATPTTASGSPATIGVGDDGNLGKILIDARGHTLYLFQKDSGTKSACFGACAVNWPPLRAGGMPTEGSGADPALVGTTGRAGGNPQVTYNGHPLYLFKGDTSAGDANGEGVNAFGGGWYALSPAGDEVAPPSNNGGGGYGY